MMPELDTFRGHGVEAGSEVRGLGAVFSGVALVLEENTEVTVTEVVCENEDDVGLGGCRCEGIAAE